MRFLSKLAVLAALAAVVAVSPAQAQMMPSWSIYGGYSNATGDGSPDGSFAVRANGFYQSNPVIGVGAELGYHNLGSVDFSDPILGDFTADFSAWQFTPMVRARGVTGPVRPYGMAGLGFYSLRASVDGTSESNTEFGFNLGGGATFGQGPTTFGVEMRWHSIQTEGEATDVVSVMGGINFN